jgi:GT2 family glycosyltransferase
MTAATGNQRISVVVPCYRDSERATALVHRLWAQQLPSGWSIEVIVVDDGSGPPHGKLLATLPGVTTMSLSKNLGRSSAVATGIDQAKGELLMVIDSDCLPTDTRLLAAHIGAMADQKVVASTGPVRGYDGRFWSRYQNDVMERRARRDSTIPGTVGSTANSCMRRQAYLGVGGLDRSYAGYGFEDRDLLLRLATVGRIAWTAGAVVQHMDELSLTRICRKIHEAGRGNSALFAKRHPAAYRELGYARFDGRGRPGLAALGRVLEPVIPRVASALDPLLGRVPFALGRFIVKAVSALAFLAGTSQAGNPGD